jgi:hypothetical protein
MRIYIYIYTHIKVKVKFRLEMVTEVKGEERFNSTLSLTPALDEVCGQRHAPAALIPKRPGTHCRGGWVGPRAVLDG